MDHLLSASAFLVPFYVLSSYLFDLCVLNPLLFSLFLSQVTLVPVLVMTSVAALLFASGTFSLPLKEHLRMSTYLGKLMRRQQGRRQLG
jgi:hypothetical protein